MSLLSWLFTKKAAPAALVADHDPLPSARPAPGGGDPLPGLKQQRHENRENLYEVVRSVMLRSEVLSSHYKFKVLSLDTQGRQFVVMIDLLNKAALPPHRWAAIEQLMATTALQHHDLQVKSIYWRMMMMPFEPDAAASAEHPASPQPSVEAMSQEAASEPIAPGPRGFEPIHQDEVTAFKKAIASGAQPQTPAPGQVVHSGARRPAPQHGFEDTQVLEPDPGASPLSKTQFGGLD